VGTLLFAYGSNLAEDQMELWCPAYTFLGPARLEGFRLEFRRRSVRWVGGAADVVEADDEEVWGALYELPDGEVERLDEKEYEGSAYRRREVEVEYDGGRRVVQTYEVIDKTRAEIAPAPAYAAAILRGMAERGLPERWQWRVEHRLSELAGTAP
jgi:gamma-glutamylcyclotransferase (GGCT)/AIG2-like uncharacterized protein YtfP